jgi:lipopolysaccharide export system ATP-binding protein
VRNGGGVPLLRAERLTKSYAGRRVVDEVSIEVRAGEVVGLLGPNGAGKTTTFHMMVGLTRPDGGTVWLDGEDVTALPMYERARRGIGYLPQEPSVFRKLTVRRTSSAIRDLDLGPRRPRAAAPVARRARHRQSGKEQGAVPVRRRAAAGRDLPALVISPAFMLLDEPFAGIDPSPWLTFRVLRLS